MASDISRREKEKKDRKKSKNQDVRERDNLDTKYECSKKFWFSLTRSKDKVPATDDEDKCSESIPFLEANQHKHNNVQDKEDLSNLENTGKIPECSNKENKKVNADTTSKIDSKLDRHGLKHHVSSSQVRRHETKFKHKLKNRKKYLLNKYKIERLNHESVNKKLNKSSSEKVLTNNASEITPDSNDTNIIQIPVQIDREKIKSILEVGSCEKKVKNNKSSYYKSETMEADSTVSNDKKDNINIHDNKNINELKDDIHCDELCKSVTVDKFLDNSNVPITPNQSFLNSEERQRKRIQRRLRYIFDQCLTMSEEEEEESILDSYAYKRQKKNFSELWNNSTNIESYKVLDMTLSQTETQDTTSNLVVCDDITNTTISVETCEIRNAEEVEAVSSVTNVIECNNNAINENIHIEEIVESPQLGNDKQVQRNVSNELQTDIDYFCGNLLLNSENNIEKKYVEESSNLKTLTDIKRTTLPDSNIHIDSCHNDTGMKTLTNYAIKITTSSEKSNSNNNFDEITCHLSQNVKELQLNTNSGNSGTTATVLNQTLDSASSVEEVLERSKETENYSKAPQDNTSIDTTKKKESAMVANINFMESRTKNTNDCSVEIQIKVTPYTETSESTQRNSDMSEQSVTNSNQQRCKQHKNVDEDLSQLLQMNINQNYRLRSDGNTISIQEDFEKGTSQYVTSKDICINNITHKENELNSNYSTLTDIALKENTNTCNMQNKDDTAIPILSHKEVQQSTGNNMVDSISHIVSDSSKLYASLDCNSKNTDNFKQPETIQPNKIRVLSSAELGSRWCPTPVNNVALGSITEAEVAPQATTVPLNDIEPSNDSAAMPASITHNSVKDPELNANLSSHCIKFSLWCICKRIMHIRVIERKYLLSNCQDVSTGNKKTMSEDLRFKSNVLILLEELLSLGKELKAADLDKVIHYAVSTINKYFISSQSEPISIDEISRYVKAFKPTPSEVRTFTCSSDTSVPNKQDTSSDSSYTAPPKPVPTVSNNANEVPVTLLSLHTPTISQVQTACSNLPKYNVHTSNVLNQSHEYNISNLQAMPKSNTSISHTPSLQPTNRNIQSLPENRMSNTYVPYCQRIIQQQPIPIVTVNNVPNANVMQSSSNVHAGHKINLHQKSEYSSYSTPLLIGQFSIPQKLPQQTIPYNVPKVPQRPQGSQIHMVQNPTHIYPTHSRNLPSGTNTISDELLFKIWDQVTFCLEKNVFDCRLHERFDKAYCYLKLFHKKWTKAMYVIIYRKLKLQSGEPITLQSRVARYIHNVILTREKQKATQNLRLSQNKELQNHSELTKTSNKNIRSKNLVSPVNIEPQNKAMQPEIVQHKSRNDTSNVGLEKQQQSQAQSYVQLLENITDCIGDRTLNASEKNNSLLRESNHTKLYNTMAYSDKTDYIMNITNTTGSTILESKIEKEENMLKSDGIFSSENNDIEILECIHRKEENSLLKQIITGEITHQLQTNNYKECSLLEQTIGEVAVHRNQGSSLPKQTIEEEIIYGNEESSLPKQTIREVLHVKEKSLLPERIIGEVLHGKEGDSLPKQTTGEVVHVREKSSLLEQTIEEIVHGKEDNPLSKQTIQDDTNNLRCDLIQSVTSSEPHIIDVRSISPTSFNKMEDIFAWNNSRLPTIENTENNEIKIKIEIPEDIICLQCSKTSTVVCEVCLEAHYCSKECAETHWMLEHHKYCKPYDLRSPEKYDNNVAMTDDTDFDVNYIDVP